MIGSELKYDQGLSRMERLYIRVFGAPISGLRIRCRRILPKIHPGFVRILDVGCGTGVLAFEIAKRCPQAQVMGIDNIAKLTAKCNSIARKAGLSNCTFVTMDVLRVAFRDAFDLILCVDNLEHIEDDVAALRRIHIALKDGGLTIIHVPAFYRRWILFGRKVNFDVPGHVRPGYTKEELVEKLKGAGLLPEEVSYTYGTLETISNNLSFLLTRAQKKNKNLYALFFPFLNLMAYLGRKSMPQDGAGVLVVARKK